MDEHAMVGALVLYTLTGGGRLRWRCLGPPGARPRRRRQRELIAHAIAPIWEANHVWLIVVIVVLFTAFPPAFSLISTALHVPLAVMLIGIVLRGAAFVFHAYGLHREAAEERRWRRLFAVSSTLTPVMLGVVLGTVSTGTIERDPETGLLTSGFFRPWLAPFPWAIGGLTLTLFAFLAAVYLTLESDDRELVDDFRRRALAAGGMVAGLAWISLLLARDGAPRLFEGLFASQWAVPFQLVITTFALAAMAALWWRRYRLARVAAIVQASLIVVGWALAQYPYLVVPDLTLHDAATEPAVLRPLLLALGAGGVLITFAFLCLYRVFKKSHRHGG